MASDAAFAKRQKSPRARNPARKVTGAVYMCCQDRLEHKPALLLLLTPDQLWTQFISFSLRARANLQVASVLFEFDVASTPQTEIS